MEEYVTARRARGAQTTLLTKLYKELELRMTSDNNVENVKNLYEKLCHRFEQFKAARASCVNLCKNSADIEKLEENYLSHEQNFQEFRERHEEWEVQFKNVDLSDNREDVLSVKSSASTGTVSSQVELKRAKAKRRVAEHRLRVLKERHTLERKQKEIENEQQLFLQQSEVDEARIEESVWEETAEEEEDLERSHLTNPTFDRLQQQYDDSTRNVGISSANDHFKVNEYNARGSGDRVPVNVNNSHFTRHMIGDSSAVSSVRRNASAVDRSTTAVNRSKKMPCSSVNSNGKIDSFPFVESEIDPSDTAFNRLASIMQEGFNLPKPELLTFSGSVVDYCKFMKNFETNVESRISDNRLRLSYLIQHCVGEAKMSIEDCVLLEPDEGYKIAKNILQSRYGRPHVIARTYIDKLLNGSQIKPNDVDELCRLALDMQRCQMTLTQLGFVSDIDNTENLRRITRRLPMNLRSKWADVAHSITESGREPRFSDLARFVNERSKVASSVYGMDLAKLNTQPNSGKQSDDQSDSIHRGKVTTLTISTDNAKPMFEKKCSACSDQCTDLGSCQIFKKMNLSDRRTHIYKHKLCFNCLKVSHISRDCRKPKHCTVPECQRKHHMLLHSWVSPESDDTVTSTRSDHTVTQLSSVHCATAGSSNVKKCLGIIPVTVTGKNGHSCQTYALLEDGADKSLCDERLIQRLNVSSSPVKFKISTINCTGDSTSGKEVDLSISPISGEGKVSLDKVWSVKQLPISTKSAATGEDIRKIHYLSDLDIPNVKCSEVMLLIGTDTPEAHVPLEVRSGEYNQPYAVRTRLGWAVRGPIVHTRVLNARKSTKIHFGNSVNIKLQQELEQVKDIRAVGIMNDTRRLKNDYHEMGVPWRDE